MLTNLEIGGEIHWKWKASSRDFHSTEGFVATKLSELKEKSSNASKIDSLVRSYWSLDEEGGFYRS